MTFSFGASKKEKENMEELKNEILTQLRTECNTQMLMIIDGVLSKAMRNYEIKKMCTDVALMTTVLCPELDAFLLRKEFRGLSDGTIKSYRYLLNNFVAWLDKDVKNVVSDDIRLFLDEYAKINDISDRTKDGKRLIICSFYQFLHQNGYISANPAMAVEPIKYNQKVREPLTQMEIELMRKACTTVFDEALFETFYSTGCRVSEIANIKISDINFDKEQIKVFGKGKKERFVLLTPRAQLALKLYLSSRNDDSPGLFVSKQGHNKPLGKTSLENRIKQIGEDATIGRVITPHILRHTFASHALNRGVPLDVLQMLLGHEKFDTTRIYAITSQERMRECYLLKCG